jgi:hypothetical protein
MIMFQSDLASADGRDRTEAFDAMQVVAVRVEDGCEATLAAVLTRLSDPGGLLIVQAVPPAARGHQPHRLLTAIEAELPPYAAKVLVLRPATVAELAAVARLRGRAVVALIPIEAVDPVPMALLLRDVLDADAILLAEQSSTGPVLQRIGPRREARQPRRLHC